jgi:hypothetical protein
VYVWVQDDGRMMSPNAFDHLSFDNAPPVAPHVVAVNEYRERRAERSMPQRPERTPRELEPPQRDAAYDRGHRNERPPREQQYGARGGGGDWDNERPPREQQYGARGGGGDWDNERPPRSGGEREPRERAPRPERAAAAPAPRLYVGGLAQATTWKELKDHFAALGPVAYCDVKLHKVGTAAVAANPALEGTSKVWLPASARPETALVSVAGFSGCERLANHPSTASIPSLQLCECLRRAIGPTG